MAQMFPSPRLLKLPLAGCGHPAPRLALRGISPSLASSPAIYPG